MYPMKKRYSVLYKRSTTENEKEIYLSEKKQVQSGEKQY